MCFRKGQGIPYGSSWAPLRESKLKVLPAWQVLWILHIFADRHVIRVEGCQVQGRLGMACSWKFALNVEYDRRSVTSKYTSSCS